MKEIVSPVFEIYAIELLGSISSDEARRHLHVRTLHFYAEYIDLPGVCIHTTVCNDSLNITIVVGSQIS